MADLFRRALKLLVAVGAVGIYGYLLLIATAVAFGVEGNPGRVLFAAIVFIGGLALPLHVAKKYTSLRLI